MAAKTMNDLFTETVRDLYDAEKKILKALPKMAEKASSEELRKAFEEHEQQTGEHVARLEEIFDLIGENAKGKKCEAIEGLIAEGEELMKEVKDGEVLDAGLLAGAQAVEHYEIARYGTLREWAELLGYDEAIPLIEETLGEEKETDDKLTRLAKSRVNKRAA